MKDEPIIMCGDFNSLPNSSVLSMIHHEEHYEKNKYHNKNIQKWYDKIWNDY